MNRRKYVRGIFKYLLIIALAVLSLYYSLGMPSLTPEIALHRKEQGILVGPSRMIAFAEADYMGVERIILGETDYGYTLMECGNAYNLDKGSIRYYEKTGNVTCFPSDRYYSGFDKVFYVYAIPENERAVHARLTLETTSEAWDDLNGVRIAEADLREGEFFLFEVACEGNDDQIKFFWKYRLQGYRGAYDHCAGRLTVELFDAYGNLLETVAREFPALG